MSQKEWCGLLGAPVGASPTSVWARLLIDGELWLSGFYVTHADYEPSPECVAKINAAMDEVDRLSRAAASCFNFQPPAGKPPPPCDALGIEWAWSAAVLNMPFVLKWDRLGLSVREVPEDFFTASARAIEELAAKPKSPPADNDGGDFIARLLAGPDNIELTPSELALLEAHLKQRISPSVIQAEKRAAGQSEVLATRNKLTPIRDFNRNLQVASAPSANETPPPKCRGRKKADYATEQREAKIAADWAKARDAGTYKGDFARDKQMKVADLDRLLDRVAARKKPSE
ncbi:MAG: hypothetical protein WCB27_17530 [Thermoguttaceae bacterium]